MNLANYLVINVFALLILFVLFTRMRYGTEKYLLEQILFLALVLSTMMILFFDTAMWIVDGQSWPYARTVNQLVSTGYYFFSSIPCLLWSLYADYFINHDSKRLQKLLVPLVIPAAINGVLSIASLYGGYMFYVDNHNIYHRAAYFLVHVMVCYLYFLYTFINIIISRRKISDNDYYSLLFFAFPPFLAGILQITFYGLSVIWISVTFSLLVIFIYLLSNQLYLDYLTGLFNRRQLDLYVAEQLKYSVPGQLIAGIMLDLNSFKEINDIYGHAMGDKALIYTANILKRSLDKNDFISRYGGDEFTIILRISSISDLDHTVHKIRSNVEQFNLQHIAPFELSFSIGYDVYHLGSGMTGHQFLQHIDALMYADKKRLKTPAM